MNYTDEIYERLIEFDRQLYTSVQLDYVRFNSLDHKRRLADIYFDHFKKKSGIMDGCSRCMLRDTKQLAKLYFEDKKARETLVQKELEPTEVKVDDTQAVTEIKPKKRATKKTKKK